MKSLEQYLKDDADRGVIDHTLRCIVKEGGRVTFYIHPQGVNGETPTFEVAGNTLAQDRDVMYPGDPGYADAAVDTHTCSNGPGTPETPKMATSVDFIFPT